ncbi:MAG: ABC transporter permease [Candidatus Wallbacteria bacterium]|nr:ABC transporter permease [Candidatus Wallbacteria bacterium]
MKAISDLDRFEVFCWFFTFLAIFFLAGPVMALFVSLKPAFFYQDAFDPEIWESLRLTLFSGFVSSIFGVLTGIPMAYVLSISSRKVRTIVEPLIEIPIILPPVIAGISLVCFLSPDFVVGNAFSRIGIHFISSIYGIIAGMYFVGVPFIVKTSLAAFQEIDSRVVKTARCLGASGFRAFMTVILPLSAPQVFTGFILMLGRSIGIFGTVVLIAYNPKTIPVLAYDRFLSSGMESAKTPAVILVLLSFVFYAMRRLTIGGK